VLRHNDRVASVQKLMHTYQKVDKFLQTKNQSEEALIERLCKEEDKKNKEANAEQNPGAATNGDHPDTSKEISGI